MQKSVSAPSQQWNKDDSLRVVQELLQHQPEWLQRAAAQRINQHVAQQCAKLGVDSHHLTQRRQGGKWLIEYAPPQGERMVLAFVAETDPQWHAVPRPGREQATIPTNGYLGSEGGHFVRGSDAGWNSLPDEHGHVGYGYGFPQSPAQNKAGGIWFKAEQSIARATQQGRHVGVIQLPEYTHRGTSSPFSGSTWMMDEGRAHEWGWVNAMPESLSPESMHYRPPTKDRQLNREIVLDRIRNLASYYGDMLHDDAALIRALKNTCHRASVQKHLQDDDRAWVEELTEKAKQRILDGKSRSVMNQELKHYIQHQIDERFTAKELRDPHVKEFIDFARSHTGLVLLAHRQAPLIFSMFQHFMEGDIRLTDKEYFMPSADGALLPRKAVTDALEYLLQFGSQSAQPLISTIMVEQIERMVAVNSLRSMVAGHTDSKELVELYSKLHGRMVGDAEASNPMLPRLMQLLDASPLPEHHWQRQRVEHAIAEREKTQPPAPQQAPASTDATLITVASAVVPEVRKAEEKADFIHCIREEQQQTRSTQTPSFWQRLQHVVGLSNRGEWPTYTVRDGLAALADVLEANYTRLPAASLTLAAQIREKSELMQHVQTPTWHGRLAFMDITLGQERIHGLEFALAVAESLGSSARMDQETSHAIKRFHDLMTAKGVVIPVLPAHAVAFVHDASLAGSSLPSQGLSVPLATPHPS